MKIILYKLFVCSTLMIFGLVGGSVLGQIFISGSSISHKLIPVFSVIACFSGMIIGSVISKKLLKNRKLNYSFIGFAIFTMIGFFIGLIIGTQYGGNYYTGFNFAGLRGYEALGVLFGIIGSIIGSILGIFLGVQLAKLKEKRN